MFLFEMRHPKIEDGVQFCNPERANVSKSSLRRCGDARSGFQPRRFHTANDIFPQGFPNSLANSDVSSFLPCSGSTGQMTRSQGLQKLRLACCSSLRLKVVDDPATRLVAEKIIAVSQHEVRGIATLHAMTVREFESE